MSKVFLFAVAAVAAVAGPVAAQTPLSVGARLTASLKDSDPQSANGQHFLCYRVAGTPGERVSIEMTSTEINPLVTTGPDCDPDGVVASYDDDGGVGLNARVIAELGDAPVFLRATAGGASHGHGEFELRLTRTQDFPSETCVNSDPARRQDAIRTCTRLADDREQPDRLRSFVGGRLAQFAIEGGDYREAVLLQTRALDVYADMPADFEIEGLIRRAIAYSGLDDGVAALRDLDEAVRLSPEMPNAWYVRGQLHEAQGRQAEALADYDRAMALSPDAHDVLSRRGSLNLDLKNYVQAIADADRAAELSPNSADYENQRCWNRAVANRDLEVAKAACDRSLALMPDRAHVLDSRALVYFRQGRFQAAWTDYDAAYRFDQRGASYLYGRGLAALKLGRTAEGQADIVAALGMDGNVAKDFADMGLRP